MKYMKNIFMIWCIYKCICYIHCSLKNNVFKTLKDDAIKVLHSTSQQILKTWQRDWKSSILIPIPKKGSTKEYANHWQLHSSPVLIILHAKTSALCELRISRCPSLIQKRKRNQRSNHQHLLDHRESQGIPENIYLCFIDYIKPFDCLDHNKRKALKELRIPDYLTCLLRNLYAGQEAIIKTLY